MKKTLFCGLPYFCKKIKKAIEDVDQKNQYFYIDTSRGLIEKVKCFFYIIWSDNVFMISGSLYNSRIIDLALLFNKKVFVFWAGTDVLVAKESYKKGLVNQDYIKKCHHLCEVGWLQKELGEIGIISHICDIAILDSSESITRKWTDESEIVVFSYIAKNREDFYGIESIYELAMKYKSVHFRICGTDGEGFKKLDNIAFLGYVEDMNREYENSHIFIRFIEHDGLAFSVLEALMHENWVIYSYPFIHTELAKNSEEIELKFKKLLCLVKQSMSNKKGREYVLKNYEKTKVVHNLVSMLNKY